MSLNLTTPFAMQKEVDSPAISESKFPHGKTLYNRNLKLELLGLFPGKALVSTEVTELGGLVVQGLN